MDLSQIGHNVVKSVYPLESFLGGDSSLKVKRAYISFQQRVEAANSLKDAVSGHALELVLVP